MSFNRSDEYLRIKPRFSQFLAWFLFIIHVVTLALIPILTLPIWVSLGMGLGVITSLVITLRTHVLFHGRRAVVGLIWTNDGHWILTYADGMVRSEELMPGSFIHPRLVVLNFRVSDTDFPSHFHSVVLCADSVEPSIFRRLRVRLRMGF